VSIKVSSVNISVILLQVEEGETIRTNHIPTKTAVTHKEKD